MAGLNEFKNKLSVILHTRKAKRSTELSTLTLASICQSETPEHMLRPNDRADNNIAAACINFSTSSPSSAYVAAKHRLPFPSTLTPLWDISSIHPESFYGDPEEVKFHDRVLGTVSTSAATSTHSFSAPKAVAVIPSAEPPQLKPESRPAQSSGSEVGRDRFQQQRKCFKAVSSMPRFPPCPSPSPVAMYEPQLHHIDHHIEPIKEHHDVMRASNCKEYCNPCSSSQAALQRIPSNSGVTVSSNGKHVGQLKAMERVRASKLKAGASSFRHIKYGDRPKVTRKLFEQRDARLLNAGWKQVVEEAATAATTATAAASSFHDWAIEAERELNDILSNSTRSSSREIIQQPPTARAITYIPSFI